MSTNHHEANGRPGYVPPASVTVAPVVADGFALVPAEPNDAMIKAGADPKKWHAILAAAPSPQDVPAAAPVAPDKPDAGHHPASGTPSEPVRPLANPEPGWKPYTPEPFVPDRTFPMTGDTDTRTHGEPAKPYAPNIGQPDRKGMNPSDLPRPSADAPQPNPSLTERSPNDGPGSAHVATADSKPNA